MSKFDPAVWAATGGANCKYRNNKHFHSHPDIPCGKHCFTDLWDSLEPEYGTPVHKRERFKRVEDNAYDEIEEQLTAKKVEYARRMDLILSLVYKASK